MVKPEKERENKPKIEYPIKTKINAYGFLHFPKNLLADLGWSKGTALIIEENPDGSITIRRVAGNA
jgi:bifunctional DNA-binding transcriptional regulator/antitoxin component of YhaV-PrlF toxin-antitoxin module